MKKLVLLSLVASFVSLASCSKNETPDEEVGHQKVSLSEFLASIGDDEKELIRGGITDNSKYKRSSFVKLASTSAGGSIENAASEAALAAVKFRWHGTGGGHGCTKYAGVCVTIPIGSEKVESNALLLIDGDKLVIQPTTNENGLTSDGYLPVGNYVPVGDDFLIKPGIYKGNSNEIVVDLIPVK